MELGEDTLFLRTVAFRHPLRKAFPPTFDVHTKVENPWEEGQGGKKGEND